MASIDRRNSLGIELNRMQILLEIPTEDGGSAILWPAMHGNHRGQLIEIVSRPCRYGGERFYFVCPVSGRRCEVLALVNGVFACRQAHKLNYRIQCEGVFERTAGTRLKLRGRLEPGAGRPRLRGANRRRIEARLAECEQALARILNDGLPRG